MVVEFDKKCFLISGKILLYDPYYFGIAARHTKMDWAGVVKNVLRQWADKLSELIDGKILYLPFGIYDHYIECLTAKLSEEQVILSYVRLNIRGWGFNLSDLSAFMCQSHKVAHSTPKIFGTFSRVELVAGLREATLIPGELNP